MSKIVRPEGMWLVLGPEGVVLTDITIEHHVRRVFRDIGQAQRLVRVTEYEDCTPEAVTYHIEFQVGGSWHRHNDYSTDPHDLDAVIDAFNDLNKHTPASIRSARRIIDSTGNVIREYTPPKETWRVEREIVPRSWMCVEDRVDNSESAADDARYCTQEKRIRHRVVSNLTNKTVATYRYKPAEVVEE